MHHYDDGDKFMTTTNTKSLLEQQAEHELAKAQHINALLKERIEIAEAHENRQVEITADLDALGYRKPRAERKKKETV